MANNYVDIAVTMETVLMQGSVATEQGTVDRVAYSTHKIMFPLLSVATKKGTLQIQMGKDNGS